MNADCFRDHAAYIKKWPNGISVCVLCNAKVDITQAFNATVLREKLHGLVYNGVGGDMANKKEPTDKMIKPKCPSCGRSDLRYRIKTKTFICRLCGEDFPRKPLPPPNPV